MDTPVPIPNTEVKHCSGEDSPLGKNSEPPGFFYLNKNLLYYNKVNMKINLVRLSNSLDPNATFKKDDDQFIEEINNELFDDDLELVEDNSLPLSFVFIETGGSEQHFVKIEESLSRPIVLLSTCKNNSLPACFEIKTYLRQKYNEDAIILLGNEKELAGSIKDVSKLLVARQIVDNASLGVIGAPSDWLIASKVDYQEVKKRFNINLVDIPTSELKEEIDKGLLDNITKLGLINSLGKDNEYLDGALRIYSGLKRIIEKYNLKGFTIRCFDLIEEYKNTACLALAMLNDEGIVGTCEGDIPSMLTMFFIKACANQPSFQANPSRIDIKTGNILFAHCTIPLNMVSNVSFMTHFESDLGIGIRGKLDEKDISLIKLNPKLDHALFLEGKIVSNPTLSNYCRTQIEVNLTDEDGLYNFLRDDFGNHVIIAYGNIIPEFLNLLHFYNQKNKD